METPGVIALDHVQLAAPAGSEPALREFYVDLLGLEEREKPEELHVGIDEPAPVNLPSRRHVALRVNDLEAMRARLTGAGCAIEDDRAPIEGCRRFYVRDPAGNRVELLERT
jgi:catechol 2,3-dioxygenase-like lactoylglutathione lyase family enzyme